MKISHIINPVKVSESSDLFHAQPMTFQSMIESKKYALERIHGMHVIKNPYDSIELLAAYFEEDEELITDHFIKTTPLKSSLLDVITPRKPRKLPFIKDILDKAAERCTNEDYIIYSNVDIALTKEFYTKVIQYIELGHDAIIVNRITMPSYDSQSLQWFLDNIHVGRKHPGYDCFILRKDVYQKFILGKIVVGVNWIGEVLLRNVLRYSHNPIILTSPYMTFHMGDDLAWTNPDYEDQKIFNQTQAHHIINRLQNINT